MTETEMHMYWVATDRKGKMLRPYGSKGQTPKLYMHEGTARAMAKRAGGNHYKVRLEFIL